MNIQEKGQKDFCSVNLQLLRCTLPGASINQAFFQTQFANFETFGLSHLIILLLAPILRSLCWPSSNCESCCELKVPPRALWDVFAGLRQGVNSTINLLKNSRLPIIQKLAFVVRQGTRIRSGQNCVCTDGERNTHSYCCLRGQRNPTWLRSAKDPIYFESFFELWIELIKKRITSCPSSSLILVCLRFVTIMLSPTSITGLCVVVHWRIGCSPSAALSAQLSA